MLTLEWNMDDALKARFEEGCIGGQKNNFLQWRQVPARRVLPSE